MFVWNKKWNVPVVTFIIGPVYKTNLVLTKSLSNHGLDQIWLC